MTTTNGLPPPDPCGSCSISRQACDRTRELRGHPCCDHCGHPDNTPPSVETLGGRAAEDW